MKKKILVAAALASIVGSQAQAAHNHTGFSIGANVGAMSVDGSIKRNLNQAAFPGGSDSSNMGTSAPLIGLFLGYGWSPNPVGIHVGAELFGQLQNINLKREDGFPPNILFTQKVRTTNTFGAAAKFGYLCKEALFYVKLGISSARWKFSFQDAAAAPFTASTSNSRKTGFLAGLGIDYVIARHWALGAEYLYTAYGSVRLNGAGAPGVNIGSMTYKPRVNTFNLRLKFTF